MSIETKIIRALTHSRVRKIRQYAQVGDDLQKQTLEGLINTLKGTAYGIKHTVDKVKRWQDFAEQVPVVDYDDIQVYIERMLKGERNVLTPYPIKWYAKSSGTTGDRSKYIPVSHHGIHQAQYRGAKDAVALYLDENKQSKVFGGKALTLGGSCELADSGYSRFGDLSAILLSNSPWYAELRRTPNRSIVMMDDWESKLSKICEKVIRQDVRSLHGVPSWFMVLLKRVLEETKADSIVDIWPNMELFIHGGINFTPYRDQYRSLIPSARMNYLETYNASEGFFAIQDRLGAKDMLLMLDYGVYYEFCLLSEVGKPFPKTFNYSNVELGVDYAIIISSGCGLWRYMIGDTVRFTSLRPHRLVITGRTKYFINAFGEELMMSNAEKALESACKITDARIKEFTAGPVFMTGDTEGAHEWVIEFEIEPNSQEKFKEILDQTLRELNSDYDAKRYKNITLGAPIIRIAPSGTFFRWMKSRGKLGGQNKVPRLANHRKYLDEVVALIQTQ